MLNETINLSQTGLLYNPQLLNAEMAEKLFVVRQKQFELLLNNIMQEKEDSIPQHHLIIGQRGMGKTMLLKRVEVELHKEQYRKLFIPLIYREEQYNVNDLAEFWLNTLDAFADSLQLEKYSKDTIEDIDKTIRELSRKSHKIISEESYKYFMSICHGLQRRPVLLIDNIDLIFRRLDNDKENKTEQWNLRKLLSENGAPIVVGGGVTITDDTSGYGMPFYDFFQIQYLYKLNYDEFVELLKNLATVTNRDETVLVSINENSSRQKSLLELTGGSPRLTAMLFEQIAKGFSNNVYDDLEKLADTITPLYKARFEELPTQQQIILDAIALNWDAISLKNLSTITHMKNNQLSPQLKRLIDNGWIETTTAYKAKGNAYFISERFFNIYYLIRNSSRRHKDRIYCLSKFLECFYGKEELEKISDALLEQDISSFEQLQLHMAFLYMETLNEEKRQQVQENIFKVLLEEESEELRKEFGFPKETFLFVKGCKLFDEEKYEEAIMSFDEILKTNPVDDNVWAKEGEALGKSERYEDAIKCFDKALEINPKNESAMEGKGRILSELGKYDEAIECFDSVTRLNPKNKCPKCLKGRALMELKRFEEAVICFSNAIKSGCDHESILNGKGKALVNLQHYDEAVKCFDKALEINPKNEFAMLEKGKILSRLGKYHEAIEYFDSVIILNPKNKCVRCSKGATLTKLERFEEAVTCVSDAIELGCNSESVWIGKGDVLMNLQRYDEAINCFDKVIELNQKIELAWYDKGFALTNLQRYEEAIICFDKAIELDQKHLLAWYGKGFVLTNLQRYEEAIGCFDKAVQLDPKYRLAWYSKGGALTKLQRFEEAIDCFDKAIELNPKDTFVLNNKGYALIELKKYMKAADSYYQAITINSESLLSKFNLLFLYRDKLDEMNKAIELFNTIDEKVVNKNKTHSCRYYLHKTLFELYRKNQGTAQNYLFQAFKVLEEENKISSMANEIWWIRFGYAIIKLHYGSWFITILEENGYDITLSPYYAAIKALDIETQDSKNGKEDSVIYLTNRAIEISDPAKKIIERIRKYMD